MDWMAIAAAAFMVAGAMPIVRWLSRSRIESSALSQAWLAEHYGGLGGNGFTRRNEGTETDGTA